MYRRPPMTRNKVATAAKIPITHNLRPLMTSGMVLAARTCGAGVAAIKSAAAETMRCACMGALHKGFVGPPRWESRALLAGGGAPPYVVAKVGGQYAVPDRGQPPEVVTHRGGHAISGVHRPDLRCQPVRTPRLPDATWPDLTAQVDAGADGRVGSPMTGPGTDASARQLPRRAVRVSGRQRWLVVVCQTTHRGPVPD